MLVSHLQKKKKQLFIVGISIETLILLQKINNFVDFNGRNTDDGIREEYFIFLNIYTLNKKEFGK